MVSNHENFDLLYQFPSQNKFGGIVRQISDSIFHLTRGQVFTIDGLKFFTMGGATSHDKGFRRDYVNWWPQEMPNYAEYEEALYNLEQNKWKVDYILTHCAPASIQKAINQSYQTDALTLFLEQIAAQTSYKKWYFGPRSNLNPQKPAILAGCKGIILYTILDQIAKITGPKVVQVVQNWSKSSDFSDQFSI